MPESDASFRDREWKPCYRHEDGDLTELFYNPALANAVRYDRMTGYFSAGALALAARGISALIANEGKMRLLVGCKPNPPESDAIDKGYDLRAKIEQKLLDTELAPPDEPARQALEMLAWMVANGYLDVKVAVPIDAQGRPEQTTGIYHEKVGILTDSEGDQLTFSGSINETWNGWMENRETFHVFCSWLGQRELAHVHEDVEAFAKFWEDRARSVRVFDFPNAAKEKLLEFLPASDRFLTPSASPEPEVPAKQDFKLLPDERTRIVWTFMANAARLSTGERVGEKTSAVEPWPHQIRTAHSFLVNWPSRLLIADEVGLGKTISAGLVIRQALLSGRAQRILLLTPKAVQIQWQNELYEKFNLSVPIYDGSGLNWRRAHCVDARWEPVDRQSWQKQPIVLCSSALMRRKDRQPEILNAEEWDLVVLDEAHHARRRGAGSVQEKGPNALLSLMLRLKSKCKSLLLLTATPMQVHPVEVWDLLNLLGLPPRWAGDDSALARYFDLAGGNPNRDEFEWLAATFRDCESFFQPLADEEIDRILGQVPRLRRKRIVEALRAESALRRNQLDSDMRRGALKFLLAVSPLRFRMVRQTRELLRAYAKAGKLALPIADREPKDVPIDMTPAEAELYKAVEEYISKTYNTASPEKRNAVGFVMTIYRRRLASSFEALRRTLIGRLGLMGYEPDELEEDVSQDETADDVMTAEEARDLAQEALGFEEKESINNLLRDISKINVDSKSKRLITELKATLSDGYDSAIVFTQFTDTMDYLRELLAMELTGLTVASYSGKGGAYRDGSGYWVPCSKEEIKRRLRTKQVKLLVATDAAGEGLNLQYCGVLVNYDLPWNPMKVEQRIGRIDRLGQKYPKVRIINLAYKGTVEADVYFVVGARIQLFQGIVGKLQPILSRLPKQIEQVMLETADNRDALRQRFLAEVDQQVTDADKAALDIDTASFESLEVPPLPEPAMTLDEIDAVLRDGRTLPKEIEWKPLDPRSYSLRMPGMENLARVTTDADVFEYSGENHQLFSPGGQLFTDVQSVGAAEGEIAEGDGICWIANPANGGPLRFLVRTKFGVEEIDNLDLLRSRLALVCQGPPPELAADTSFLRIT
jgi:SNF2 family DNA or RNA helicase